jgi:hypothetical protein
MPLFFGTFIINSTAALGHLFGIVSRFGRLSLLIPHMSVEGRAWPSLTEKARRSRPKVGIERAARRGHRVSEVRVTLERFSLDHGRASRVALPWSPRPRCSCREPRQSSGRGPVMARGGHDGRCCRRSALRSGRGRSRAPTKTAGLIDEKGQRSKRLEAVEPQTRRTATRPSLF